MQIFAIVVSLAFTVTGIALFTKAIGQIVAVLRMGGPATPRTDQPAARTVTLVKETLGHTRMLQWTWVGIGHWFIFVGFGLLFFTLLTAFGQLFDAEFALPVIGHFFLYEWASEFFTVVMLFAIVAFLVYRLNRPKERVRGDAGRFWGSTMWQGYFVETVILLVGLCIFTLRGLEYALFSQSTDPEKLELASAFHFPFTFWLGELFAGLSTSTLENLIYLVAMLKIVVSFTWMIVLGLNPQMGVAWHRFTAFFNIWLKREASGRTALGAVKPITSGGKVITLDDIDDLDEDSVLGVGKVEDFSWKAMLDFTTCTECGRCQSQCPAWNTDKPLSPKLLITSLRDHAYAKAPYATAKEGDREKVLASGGDTLVKEVERPLIGDESVYGVIDPDVLWSCTSCGACVQQCPVDIEHVDHIVDMRRYQLLVESNFPAELNQLFKGLEGRGNPWNMSPNARLEWAQGLDFEVKVVGETIESLDEVEWLFWVGCAGAYEDRAKKTTRAVAELLDMAGVTFGVLGNGETCTGDPARRAGNEFVFQGLAQQNAETFKEYRVKKVVSTCAHCFNTLKNEYKEFGVELEVVHHTQLLNRLVREGRLTPVKDGAGAHKRSITYHDPCYIGRHNDVYTPPRELLQILPGAEVKEMPRNSERSFCCGAGGARMWMEEKIGERINLNRTQEAVATEADQIAVGCPFCRVMLSDGLTAMQDKGEARPEVEVLDVAQMLLASVKGEVATKVKPGELVGAGAPTAKAGAAAGTATADVATQAEPAAGDVTATANTVTETADAGPLAKASGGSSLFDTPASPEGLQEKPAAESYGSLFDTPSDDPQAKAAEEKGEEKAAPAKPAAGGSLFDLGAPEEPKAAAAPEAGAEPAKPASGGSLFDLAAPEEPKAAPAAEASAPAAPQAAAPATEVPTGGSLFDLAAPEPAPAAPAPAAEAPKAEEPKAEAAPAAPAAPAAEKGPEPATSIPTGGSLFDLAAPEAPAPSANGSTNGTAAHESAPAEAAPAAEEPEAEQPEAPEAEAEQEEVTTPPAPPAASGPAHTPRTDADISGSSSLFDL